MKQNIFWRSHNMQEEAIQHFYNNEEKLNFLIKYLKLNIKDIANLFGVQPNYISKLREHTYDALKPMHLYAFAGAYGIPYKIFEDRTIKTSAQIVKIIEEQNREKKEILFKKDEQLLKNIQGEWYAYFYPSNQFSDIYRIQTTINPDGTVIDKNKNWGKLLIGTNQSLIVKEAFNSKNLVTIIFDNHQVAYDMFHFSLVSKRNHVNREMFNYGFFSRHEIELDRVKTILGNKEHVQLKMQCEFVERIAEHVESIG